MYRLLVADDEQIVIDAIKFIIEKDLKGVIDIETAKSGREAVEKAGAFRPDIIFMDIKMPGMDGIEAIKEIKSHDASPFFVIITAYEQFDFAKAALKLGVVEYILKPVNRGKIIETLRKVAGIIDAGREKTKKELELKEKLDNVLPVLESGFIYSIALFDNNRDELDKYTDILGLRDSDGYILTAEFREEDSAENLNSTIKFSIRSQSFYQYFRDIIKDKCKCVIGPLMLNRIIVFIPSDINGDEYSQRLEALNIAEYLFTKLEEKMETNFIIGIGRRYKQEEHLYRSYEESLKAIRYAENKGIVHIMDVPIEKEINLAYPYAKEKLLLEKATLGETHSCLQLFGNIFEWLSAEYAGDVYKVKNKLFEIMVLLHRSAWDYGIYEGDGLKKIDYLEELMSLEDIPGMQTWCKERIKYITRGINNARENKINSLILKARDYIDLYYKKDITLEDVSREVNISPHYFSRLFKEETGKNFIEYLTLIRIQKAKELLEDGGFSVKEICYDIGYGDPNYFSRIFKKIVGITPTEYKDAIQK